MYLDDLSHWSLLLVTRQQFHYQQVSLEADLSTDCKAQVLRLIVYNINNGQENLIR